MRALATAVTARQSRLYHVQSEGWSGIRNGDLLQRAEAEFDLFITSDQNIRYQQSLLGRRIAILELSTNDIRRIRAAASILDDAVAKIRPNSLERLEIP